MSNAADLQLPQVLDLNAAAPLAADILARRGQALDLDASQVQRLGGQCLQVLLSAAALWRADGGDLRLVSASSRFRDDYALFGAADLLPITSEMNS